MKFSFYCHVGEPASVTNGLGIAIIGHPTENYFVALSQHTCPMSHPAHSEISLFQAAVDNSYDVVELLREDGTFLYVNDSIRRVLGFAPDELVGTNAFDLVHPADVERVKADISHTLAYGNGEVHAYRCRDTGGAWRLVKATGARFALGDDQYAIVINARDITEEAENHQALAKISQDMLTIWESMSDAFYALDKDWRITYVNAAAEHSLNRPREELVGRRLWEEFPEAVGLAFFQKYHQAVAEQKEVSFEEFYPPLNSWFEVRAYPSAIGLTVYFHNIDERKQAEAERERFFTLSLDLLCIFDKHGILSRVNPAFESILGYKPEELLGQCFLNLLPPSERKYSEQGLALLASGVPVTDFVNRLRCADGTYKNFLWATAPYGDLFYGAGRDITAIKTAEDEREQSLALLKATFESTADGILVVNEQGKITHYNEQFLRLWSIPREMIVTADNAQLISYVRGQLVDPKEFETSAHASDPQQAHEGFDLLHFKDGRIFERYTKVLQLQDSQVERVWSFRDISERIQAQEEQSRLAALLKSTNDFVGWADANGHVQYVNPAGRVMVGLSSDEPVEGLQITSFCPDRVHDALVNVALPGASQKGSWSGENVFVTRDGREFPVSQVITAHKDAEGNAIFYSTIARDISESKRAHAILEQANEELEARVNERTNELAHINRELEAEVIEKQNAVGALREVVVMLENARNEATQAQGEAERANRAKSEFLSRMSHELRTPLNAILGFGQLLGLSKLDETQNERLILMMNASEHLLELINEVLDIAHVESGALALSIETVQMNEIVAETLALMQPLAQRRQITVINGMESDDRLVRADPHRLKQVLLNLLSNAIKYNDDGGRIILDSATASNGHASISISNTGRGITPSQFARLFTPFERLGRENSQIEGTGLGLALSKRLLEAMQGSIEVESQPLIETTFRITLPVS